jgi:hypothetical protein
MYLLRNEYDDTTFVDTVHFSSPIIHDQDGFSGTDTTTVEDNGKTLHIRHYR